MDFFEQGFRYMIVSEATEHFGQLVDTFWDGNPIVMNGTFQVNYLVSIRNFAQAEVVAKKVMDALGSPMGEGDVTCPFCDGEGIYIIDSGESVSCRACEEGIIDANELLYEYDFNTAPETTVEMVFDGDFDGALKNAKVVQHDIFSTRSELIGDELDSTRNDGF